MGASQSEITSLLDVREECPGELQVIELSHGSNQMQIKKILMQSSKAL